MGMGVVDGAGEGLHECRREPRRLRCSGQCPCQGATFDVLQSQVGLAVVLADLVNLHQVGMLAPCDGRGFPLEPGTGAGSSCRPSWSSLSATFRFRA